MEEILILLIIIATLNYLGIGFILAHKISEKYGKGDVPPPTVRKISTLIFWPLLGLLSMFYGKD